MHGLNKDNDYIAMVKIALQQAQLINNATGQHLVKVFATDWTHYQPLITDSWILANLDGGRGIIMGNCRNGFGMILISIMQLDLMHIFNY